MLGEMEFEVRDGFNDLLKIDALANRKDDMDTTEFVQEFLKISLGEEMGTKLINMNYPIRVYTKIMNCIQDVYSGSEEEGASSEERAELV